MSTLKTTNLQNADASSANIVLGQGSGGGATITGVSTFVGNVSIADKIIHTGDTDTAIRFSGADTITAETGGSERIRIDSTGKAAIGNASPQQLLHVWPDTANTTSAYIRVTAGDRGSGTGLDLGHDASGNGHVNMVSNGNLTLSTNDTARIFIKNTGNVGINTDNPTAPLAVMNSSDPEIRFGYNETQDHRIAWDSSKVHIHADPDNANGSSAIGLNVDGTTRLYIDDNGDIKVNTGDLYFGTAGKGIVLGATSNTDANTLEDYEEGTFTPTASVEGESAANTDKNYGRYVKVGNKVTVWCYVQLNGTPSNRAGNKAWQHGGLPFTHRNVTSGFDIAGTMIHWTLDSNSGLSGTAPYTLVPRLFNNATSGRIRAVGSDENQTGNNASLLMKDNTEYTYTFTYETA